MKVLFFVYPWAFQSPGGGEIFLLKTRQALEKMGVMVKLFNQWEDRLKEFDLLHVFGSVKECLPLMQSARQVKVKTVLSPIFWSSLERSLFEQAGPLKRSAMTVRHISKALFPIFPSPRRKMFLASDIILPNSQAEASQLSRFFGIARERMRVVPLGADESFANADKREFVQRFGMQDFVLSVGRIEPRKNQLNLIRALRGRGLKLVFIGEPVIGSEGYFAQCRRLAGKDTVFLSALEHDSSLLASGYAACAAFVLQGWFETPGLAALEAGLCGAKLAVTARGATREYFKDYAQYFNPASLDSIRQAVYRALEKKDSGDLKKHILTHYLWSHTAQATLAAYDSLLNK